MNETEIKDLVSRQRRYFLTGETLPVEARLEALKKLKKCIQEHEREINEALKADLGKSAFESYMCETGLVLSELSYMIKNSLLYPGTDGTYAYSAVFLKELPETLSLWGSAYHEPLELSFPFEHRSPYRRHSRRKHSHCKAQRLLSQYQPCH